VDEGCAAEEHGGEERGKYHDKEKHRAECGRHASLGIRQTELLGRKRYSIRILSRDSQA
jgi:hypothetical protein